MEATIKLRTALSDILLEKLNRNSFSMISKIIFESFGIFPDDSDEFEDSFNKWILNELMFLSVSGGRYSAECLKFQEEVLCSSSVRRPTFFAKASEHYLEFFSLILNHKDNNEDDAFIVPSAEYEFLSEPIKNLKKYNKNIEFKKLPLKPNTYKCILSICKSAVIIGIRTCPKIFQDSSKQIISVLSEADQLSIQIFAFDFLNTFLENSDVNLENINIASHLCNALKTMGGNIQKYKKLEIVKEEELKHFKEVHHKFYANRFWNDKRIESVSEILAFAVEDTLNPLYKDENIDHVFDFISKLSDISGETFIPLQKLKHFFDNPSPRANHVLIQHLVLALDTSEELFKEALKILNITFKGEELDGYLGKVSMFKKLKQVFINSQQRKDFKIKKTLITLKSYSFPSDFFFGNYELFVLKFISLAKTSKEYSTVLQILSAILEEDKFYKYLFPANLPTIVNIFHQAFTSNHQEAIKAAFQCNINSFPQSAKKQLQQMLSKLEELTFAEHFVLNGWISEYNEQLKPSCLLLNDGVSVFEHENEVFIICRKCSHDSFDYKFEDLLFEKRAVLRDPVKLAMPPIPKNIILENLKLFTKHSTLSSVEDQLENIDLNLFLVKSILERSSDSFSRELILKLGKFLRSEVKTSLLKSATREYQMDIAETICLVSKIPTVQDNMFANYFKMLFFYVMSSDSKIAPDAEKLIQDMCMNKEIKIQLMFSVHRMKLLEIIVMLAVNEYSRHRRKLGTSVKSLSKIFKSKSCPDFIWINIQYITAMIIPYTVQNSQALDLLNEISRIRNKDLKYILKLSFLKIYVYVSLNEPEDIARKSIEYVESETSMSLFDLFQMDIKKTIDEVLIWFHKDYNFAIRSFTILLNLKSKKTNDIKKYISERFLGLLTSFESLLIQESTESYLKTEMILSLGEIIRFIGSESIALFKFKIITMLTTISMMQDEVLQEHSLEAWNIFLHNIDIESVGPSLGRIVAGMEPLLQNKKLLLKVNTILKFLINAHGNLLGKYIPDVFFIEKLENVSSEVKDFVSSTTRNIMRNKNVFDQLMFYNKQITDENVFVGKYSLEHLKDFIREHKTELCSEDQYDRHLYNQMVLNLFNMICAKSYDPKMKVITSQCLGEIGAMESCYLFGSTSNVEKSSNSSFSFSIHTDSFAILALKELCRAMQFLKDTKYMDNFSLAIQEIFNDRKVNPKENKKIDIWNSIPDKMKPIVEPFLTSFYAGRTKDVQPYNQIVFNKNRFKCHEDWALNWSSKIIEFINTEETKNLLQDFEPAMKGDSSILKLFLPYILLHVLHECTDIQMEMISEELKFIFNQAAKDISFQDRNFESSKLSVKSVDIKCKQKSSDEADFLIIKCSKVCFDLIEFLDKWKVEYISLHGIKSQENEKYLKIHNFVECFDKLILAKANYNCGEFTRSLQYMELFIGNSQKNLEENMSFMIQLYAELGDSDSLEGSVTLKQTDLSIKEQLLLNTLTDQISNIPVSYAQIINYDLKNDDLSEKNINHLIESYSRIETPDNVLLVIDTLWKNFNTSFPDKYFNEHKAEPLWKLGRFEELDSLLTDDPTLKNSKNWGIKCGQSLMLLQQNDESKFFESINEVRMDIVKSCEHVSGNAYDAFNYQRLYKDFIKLHQIQEIEQTKNIINEIYQSSSEETALVQLNNFLQNWKLRLKTISPTLRSLEPVLNLRRSLLAELSKVSNSRGFENIQENIKNEIGELYIQTIQLYRKSGWFQQCQIAILKAEEYSHRKLFIEKAKLHWCKGDQSFTFKILEKNISELKEKAQTAASQTDDRLIYAEAKFLIASYNADSMSICADLNIQYFKEAVNANKKSEKCFVHFAQYLDKLYSKMSKEAKDSQQGLDSLLQIMVYYARSMSYGCEFMFQSMPRLLSVWLDFQPETSNFHANTLKKMCNMMEQCSKTLPLFIFYSAFSQIISRICHPSNEVYQVLKTIVINLLLAYPQQSLWMISQVFKSTYSHRQKRCIEIYKDKRLEDADIQKLIRDFNTLADLLIELTNKEIAKTNTHPKVSQLVPRLPKLFKNSDFSKILLPFEKVMQITLPGLDHRRSPAKNHEPFPHKGVYICGIRDEIVELQSLIRPRKVTVICDDGKEYTIMMKPKDDLRKDFRLMEFNCLVKQCLSKNEQARLRNLDIRTYSVMPLNEECGLIEWVHNLETLRGIVKHLHKLNGFGMENRELKKYDSHHNDPIESKREKFTKYLLPRHPPLFYQWFINSFSSPQHWYQAKTAYIRTLAVMSTVGFILGLGDRHGENILLDKSTGHAVHVDFNCLFNLGETYQYAEKVPFRLTHSMVQAMGPLGVEGGFRKCCEITMGVLRNEMPVLMSVLRPFVYDPLVAWNKSTNNSPSAERTDPKAMANLKRIEERLEGYVKVKGKSSNIPLSVDGQVNYIIKEATDIDNLASMFIGWGSYL